MKVRLTLDTLIRQLDIGRDGEVEWGKFVVIDGLPVNKEEEGEFITFIEGIGEKARYFTKTQLYILYELAQRKGKPVKAEIFFKYFKYSSTSLVINNLEKQISEIRRRAKQHNIPLKIVNIRRGFFNNDGYYMEVG